MEHSHIPIEGLVEHSHSTPFKRKFCQTDKHRPSVLCISDADDDDKLCGLMKASKALLPQEEGSVDDNGWTISTRPSNISEYGT